VQGRLGQPQTLPDPEAAGAQPSERQPWRSRLPRALRFLSADEAGAGSAFELDDRAWLDPAQAAAAPSLARHYIGDAQEEAEAGGRRHGRQGAAVEVDAFQLADSVWRSPMLAV